MNLFGDRLLLLVSPTLSLPFRLSAINPGPSGENASQSTFTEELQFQGRTSDDRLFWQAGGYAGLSNPLKSNTQLAELFLTCNDAAAFDCVPALGATSSLGLQDTRYRFRNLGAYAQVTYNFTDQLGVTAGIRYTSDRIKARARNATVRFLPGLLAPFIACSKTNLPIPSLSARAACNEEIVEKSARPTWLIGLDYKPQEDVLIYGKYARGYRQGTINLLPLSPALTTTGPEKVDTYELGAKATFRDPLAAASP